MRHVAAILLAAFLVAGCSTSGTSASPSLSPGTTPSSAPAGTSPTSSSSAVASSVPSSGPSAPAAGQTTWSRVADQPSFSDAFPTSVAAGIDRYVAVGCGSTASEPTHDECVGVAWVSTDARTWRRVTLPSADHTYLSGVIASPVGYLAWAYGLDGTPGALIWRSADGLSWQRASPIPSSAYENIGAVVWFKDRFVALADLNEPRAWSSADGLTWTQIPVPDGCGAVPATKLLAVLGDRLVALGEHVAQSMDGSCWTIASTSFPGWPIDATIVRGRLVVVGSGPDTRLEAGVLPPLGAWTSGDGTSFAAARFDGTVRTDASFQVLALGGRLVALGTAVVEEVLTPMAWESSDGQVWEPGAPPDVTREGTSQGFGCTPGPCTGYRTGIRAMANGPSGLVAVGSTQPISGGPRLVVWLAST